MKKVVEMKRVAKKKTINPFFLKKSSKNAQLPFFARIIYQQIHENHSQH